jgi:hypothetical protein
MLNDYDAPQVDVRSIKPEEFDTCEFLPDFVYKMRSIIWFNPATPRNHSIYKLPSGDVAIWAGRWRNVGGANQFAVESLNYALSRIAVEYFKDLFATEEYAAWQKAKSPEMYCVLKYFFGGACSDRDILNLVS